ncbi:cardiolipin synthase [Lactococcus kimchii]|uniref:cardiolipin synthase n=1 Tax=Lactococcus sp. S-13 TaxID=2507158 RepID=UPI001022F0DE|nr:cardiolipin synthase [Lactococcus sp. S-13]RZI48376.1 cardiolipin synthase [Lactococcus sp. S-13]
MDVIALLELALFLLNVGLSFVIIFRERKSTAATWSWLFVVNVIPFLGFILYLLIGRGISHYRIFKDRKRFQIGFEKQLEHAQKAFSDGIFIQKMRKNHVIGQLINMLYVEEKSIISTNTGIKIFNDGREKFDALIEDINQAKHHVHMEYYIFRMDHLGQEIYEALLAARERGVEVKLLIDAWGSNKTKMKEFKELEDLGGHVAQFFPLILPLINPRTNYRLHRKIVVIDGVIGYTGGFNVGDEYASVTKKFGYWRDNHLRLTGDIVYSLQHRFILDWNSQHRFEITRGEPYFPDSITAGTAATQLVTSGPDEDKEQIKLAYMKMVSGAEREIVIQTPYYIPSDALHESIKLALLSGVQVKMLIPNKPDHPLVYWATYFHAAELVKYGAKVYTYENGFVHSKTLIVDGEYASVGSANLDYRSLQLCFEANVIIYDYDIAQKLRNDFMKDLKLSKALTLDRYDQRKRWIRFKEGLARLIAPML